VLGVGLCKATI